MNSIEISQGGSNTDSGSKRGVKCKYTTTSYLAFIIRFFYTINNIEKTKTLHLMNVVLYLTFKIIKFKKIGRSNLCCCLLDN